MVAAALRDRHAVIERQLLTCTAGDTTIAVATVDAGALGRADRPSPPSTWLAAGRRADAPPTRWRLRPGPVVGAVLAVSGWERPGLVDRATAEVFPLRHPAILSA
jgi:hypothetical protein